MGPKKNARSSKAESKPAEIKDEAPPTKSLDDSKALNTGQKSAEEVRKPLHGSATPNKRVSPPSSSDKPTKAPRRSGRSAPKPAHPTSAILSFLLSHTARDLARPKDEQSLSTSTKTYTNNVPMTPFEELVCAVVLSRPISHALGQRTIRTIFNDPYNVTTPGKLKDIGEEKLHEALWEAKTQHKQKTVEQLLGLAAVILDKFADEPNDTSLEELRKDAEYDRDVLAETVRNSIKGIGATAVNIFLRRVQGHWRECYPFVDDRTAKALEGFGLPGDADELEKALEKEWKGLKVEGFKGEEGKRMAFVIVLERAVGLDLEGKAEEALQQIGA